MSLITVTGLCMDFGEQLLFENMNFEIQKGDRIGLIGVNGCGKTTLSKLLTGEYSPTDGTIVINKNTSVGYMEQHVCRNLTRSAYDEVMTVFSELIDMENELESLQTKLGKSTDVDELIHRQDYLNDQLIRRGGLTCRSRARSALLGLGVQSCSLQSFFYAKQICFFLTSLLTILIPRQLNGWSSSLQNQASHLWLYLMTAIFLTKQQIKHLSLKTVK